jgi:hypothetical protein
MAHMSYPAFVTKLLTNASRRRRQTVREEAEATEETAKQRS